MNNNRLRLRPCLLLAVFFFAIGARADDNALDGTQALPAERVIVANLRGIVCAADAADLDRLPTKGFAGVDTARAPLLRDPAAASLLTRFLDKPASFPSLDRIAIGIRTWLRLTGQPFVVVYMPPQNLDDGVVRFVVRPARLDGELKIQGAEWFSEESYRAALPIAAGDDIDGQALQAGVERLNRNPYRRVTVAAEPGDQPGSTRLALHAKEARPWEFTLGANNTGTAVTGHNRLTAGVTWGNAFGRGDTLGYGYSADPDFKHFESHTFNYGAILASGHSLAVNAAASRIESALPEPLTQNGSSWQIGARYGVPLGKSADGWEQGLSFGADFKYSDNNLEFSAIPVTNTVSHVVQFGATWSGQRQGASLAGSLHASPGGLSRRNDDESFDAVRAGAKAAYLYGRLDGQLSLPLGQGFAWTLNATAQVASAPLLGTEQMMGGGASAVRGYPESSAFGDGGLAASTALHLPTFSPFGADDHADAFVFMDAAVLRYRGPDASTTHLASAGIGLGYRVKRHISLAATYGRQLKEIPSTVGRRRANGHVSAVFRF